MSIISSSNLPILVVGAGPSGLMMALILAKLGEKVRIIDKDLKPNIYSKAIVVQIRTLEIFKSLGLVQKLRKHAVILKSLLIHNNDYLVCKIDTYFEDSLFHHPWIVDQSDTQFVLETALKEYGIEVERGVEFLDCVQKDDHIEANIKVNEIISTLKLSYLIGADGAHSTIRKKINQKYQGKSYDDQFILADVNFIKNPNLSSANLYLKNKKFLAIFPMKNNSYRLISIKNDVNHQADDATEFSSLLKNLTDLPGINNTKWSSKFFIRCLSVDKYYDNKIFLVGDAAHIHSPAGGQGMNTGLQDAFNLAFKISMTQKKLLSSETLKTYHEERKPVGDFLINNTDKLFSFMTSKNLFIHMFRTISLLFLSVFDVPKKIIKIFSQTSITYKYGLLCKSNHSDHIGKRINSYQLKNSGGSIVDLHTLVLGNYFSCIIIFPLAVDLNTVKKTKKYAYNLFKLCKNVRLFFIFRDSGKNLDEENEFIIVNNTDLQEQINYLIIRPDQHIFCKDMFSNIDHVLSHIHSFS